MAFFEKEDIQEQYQTAKDESYQWRKNYDEYERLADNGLIDSLDETLPEVNDGSLAAALFKLPKRIVDSELTGRAKSEDRDEAWITELANIYWEEKIIPNANSQAPWSRKWKDAVRKAAIYGGQPIISLLVDNGDYTGADIIVPYAQDVRLEAGKVSDQDSDLIFWDVFYTRKQVKDLIEQAKKETKDSPTDGYNKWNVKDLQAIYDSQTEGEDRDANEEHEGKQDKAVTKGGVKFCIVFQRGIKAPFYMYHKATDSTVREWENPDPTGDIPVKYLYCYQDFNNPYGIGIVRLAGGTQNVLDELRRLHILATQIGIRPPKKIMGPENEVDEDSLIYAQDQNWYLGGADVETVEMANGVYNQLANTVSMYKVSLNQLIPVGDTSISGTDSGDPQYSKTPAGVDFQQNQLSIDDEDFKDNLYVTYEAVAKNCINITFANMQGSDLLKLSDEHRELLVKSGLDFPVDAEGEPTNELEIIWDESRATFSFELDAEDDKSKDEDKRLEALLKIVELRSVDPTIEQVLGQSGFKLNMGELFSSIINLTTDNDKILEEVDPEEMAQQQAMQQQMTQQQAQQQGQDPNAQQQGQPQGNQGGVDPQGSAPQGPAPEEAQANMQAVMQQYGVSAETAAEALDMEANGMPIEEVQAALQAKVQDEQQLPQGVPQQ